MNLDFSSVARHQRSHGISFLNCRSLNTKHVGKDGSPTNGSIGSCNVRKVEIEEQLVLLKTVSIPLSPLVNDGPGVHKPQDVLVSIGCRIALFRYQLLE